MMKYFSPEGTGIAFFLKSRSFSKITRPISPYTKECPQGDSLRTFFPFDSVYSALERMTSGTADTPSQ